MSESGRDVQGSVNVSRDVNVGGGVNVEGNMRAGHDLKVDGWLDAPNIKGRIRGFFRSVAELRETEPCPRAGWAAFVGDHTEATIYYAYRPEGKDVVEWWPEIRGR